MRKWEGKKNIQAPEEASGVNFRSSLKCFHTAKQIRELVYQITNFPKGLLRSGRGLVTPLNMVFYFNQD